MASDESLDSYNNMAGSDNICLRLSNKLLFHIDAITKELGLKNRQATIRQLCEGGIKLLEMKDKIKDPAILTELKKHYTNQSIVDWIAMLDDERVSVLLQVFRNEAEIRARK